MPKNMTDNTFCRWAKLKTHPKQHGPALLYARIISRRVYDNISRPAKVGKEDRALHDVGSDEGDAFLVTSHLNLTWPS